MPGNGDPNTRNDITTTNAYSIDNDLEPFDKDLDDAPSIILVIPANNRPMPSKRPLLLITENTAHSTSLYYVHFPSF